MHCGTIIKSDRDQFAASDRRHFGYKLHAHDATGRPHTFGHGQDSVPGSTGNIEHSLPRPKTQRIDRVLPDAFYMTARGGVTRRKSVW